MATAAAAAAAVAQAVKASGAIVKLEADEFQKVLYRATDPLVVVHTYRRVRCSTTGISTC